MRTLAVVILKGGSGKTTTAVNLAAALAEGGARVLVVDMDPQCHATLCLGARGAKGGTHEVVCDRQPAADWICETSAPGVSIIPATPQLVEGETKIPRMQSGLSRLGEALARVSSDFDYCIIDTPPAPGALTSSAVMACDAYLIPMEAHVLALHGVKDAIEFVQSVAPRPRVGVLPCRFEARSKHGREVLETLNKRRAGDAFETVIRTNIKIAEAPSRGVPVTVHAPKSPGAADYRDAAAELVRRWDALKS